MRLVFAGTPEFAAQALEALIDAGHEIAAVLTQPDRPAGRGLKLQASRVKTLALAQGLPVLQPKSLRLDGLHATDALTAQTALAQVQADVMVVVAYGLILPTWVLTRFPLGCLNIHASLLPRWRGAAPIQRAIQAGDAQSGVCIMQMDEGLDTGAVLLRGTLAIEPHETSFSLQNRLAALGAELIVQTLQPLPHLHALPQDAEGACYAHKISKDESPLDWSRDATSLMRQILAFNPAPGCTTTILGQTIKVWEATSWPDPNSSEDGHQRSAARPLAGEIVALSEDGIDVQCASGVLRIVTLQRPGHHRMGVKSFLQGHPLRVGLRLGDWGGLGCEPTIAPKPDALKTAR